MYEVSEEMLTFCKENMTYKDFSHVESVIESPVENMTFHKEFLKKLVTQIRKFFVSKDTKAKILEREIYESNGDITKIKSIDTSLKVLAILKKSKDPQIKKNAEMLQNLYTQIKTSKNGFLKVKGKIKTGNVYESAMADIVYGSYVLHVQCFIAGVSLTLAKVHDLGSKNPFKDYSMLHNAERVYELYRNGTMKKAINALTEKQSPHTSEAIEIAALAVIGTVIAFVTLCLSIRILVYYFYYTRMQLADYFEEQAQFLNLHKSEVKRNDNLAAREKDGIINAQKAWADRFMTLAEWIQDDDIAAAKKATSEIKKANKEVIPTNQIDVPNTGMEFF